MGVHRDFGMLVAAEKCGALQADGAITESGAFCAAGDDADVGGQVLAPGFWLDLSP